jgi:hypothetical protein
MLRGDRLPPTEQAAIPEWEPTLIRSCAEVRFLLAVST